MKTIDPLVLDGKEEWQEWLARHPNRQEGIWLFIRKKQAGPPGVFYEDALEEALCQGWIDGQMKSLGSPGYVIWFAPRRKGSLWSLRNRKKAEELIRKGRMKPAGMEKIGEARKNGNWDSAYSLSEEPVLPGDLEEALREDKTAWKNFQAFAPGYRNQYILWVTSAKTIPTRERRIREAVRRAAGNVKPGF